MIISNQNNKLKHPFFIMRFLLLTIFVLFYPSLAVAEETPYLVKDINLGSGDSNPYILTSVNGILYFTANDGMTSGFWKTNGTEFGTVKIKEKDYTPGIFSLAYMTDVNNTLYFSFLRQEGCFIHPYPCPTDYDFDELWRTDGTEAGTVMVKDIKPGGSSNIKFITNINNTLFFRADDGIHGHELWRSDGTEAGTMMVKDINPGNGSSWAENLTNINGTLYFAANDGVQGNELWKSDGTEASTLMVKDINPDSANSFPHNLINVDGTLYFIAKVGTQGINHELWRSDGTEEGTVMVKDIYPGSEGSRPKGLTNMNGTLFFWADDGFHGLELWKSDGTEDGTVMVKDINPGSDDSGPVSVFPEKPVEVDGFLFFSAKDNIHGYELWKSDGMEAGTVLVKNITLPKSLTAVNDLVFFVAGEELWKSDGTEEGTVLVADINPGKGGSRPRHLTNVNGTLYFIADDGTHGRELWVLRQTTVMPLATNKQHFTYSPVDLPILSDIPSKAKPIGIRPVAIDGETLKVMIGLYQFTDPVDIYGAYKYRDQIYTLNPDLSFLKLPYEEVEQSLSTGSLPHGIKPWVSNLTENVEVVLFTVSASNFSQGIYNLYLLVTSAGNIDNYYLWETYFVVP
jgi:ELWxxDGT repeat protein